MLTKKAVVLIAFLLSCDEFHTRCLQFTSQLSYVRINVLFLPLKCFSIDKGFENGSDGQVWCWEVVGVFSLPHLILLCSVSQSIFYLSHHQVIQISTTVHSHIVCQLMKALTKPRRHFPGCSGPKPEQATKRLPVPFKTLSLLDPARPLGSQFPLSSIKPEGISSKIISLHLMERKGMNQA